MVLYDPGPEKLVFGRKDIVPGSLYLAIMVQRFNHSFSAISMKTPLLALFGLIPVLLLVIIIKPIPTISHDMDLPIDSASFEHKNTPYAPEKRLHDLIISSGISVNLAVNQFVKQ